MESLYQIARMHVLTLVFAVLVWALFTRLGPHTKNPSFQTETKHIQLHVTNLCEQRNKFGG